LRGSQLCHSTEKTFLVPQSMNAYFSQVMERQVLKHIACDAVCLEGFRQVTKTNRSKPPTHLIN